MKKNTNRTFARPWQPPEIKEGKLTKWNWMVQGVAGLKLGHAVDIGAFTYINARAGVTIEDNVQIGSHCCIYSQSTIDDKVGAVIIKKGARIGTHTSIMPGVTIGVNAVVGAHSFVNKDVPTNSLALGVPIKIRKYEKNSDR